MAPTATVEETENQVEQKKAPIPESRVDAAAKEPAKETFINEANMRIPDEESAMNVAFQRIRGVSSAVASMSKPAVQNTLHALAGISGEVRTERAINAMFPDRSQALSSDDLRQMRTDLGRNPDQVIGIDEVSLQRAAAQGNKAVKDLAAKGGLPKGGLTDAAINEMADKLSKTADYNSTVESNAKKVTPAGRGLLKLGVGTLAAGAFGGVAGAAMGLILSPFTLITKPIAWCVDKVLGTNISKYAGPTGFIGGGAVMGAGIMGFKGASSIASSNMENISFNSDMRKAHKLALVQGIRKAVEAQEQGGVQAPAQDNVAKAQEAARGVAQQQVAAPSAQVNTNTSEVSAPTSAKSGIENGKPVGFQSWRAPEPQSPNFSTGNGGPIVFRNVTRSSVANDNTGKGDAVLAAVEAALAALKTAESTLGGDHWEAIRNSDLGKRISQDVQRIAEYQNIIGGANEAPAAKTASTDRQAAPNPVRDRDFLDVPNPSMKDLDTMVKAMEQRLTSEAEQPVAKPLITPSVKELQPTNGKRI